MIHLDHSLPNNQKYFDYTNAIFFLISPKMNPLYYDNL